MRAFRRHIAGWTALWFLAQAAFVAATPVAAYGLAHAGDAGLPECCRNLKPGQTCPMHPHGMTADGEDAGQACHVSAACRPLHGALLSLATAFGVAPAALAVAVAAATPGAFACAVPQPLSRASRPDSPPPRA